VVSFQVILEEKFMVGYDMDSDMAASTMGIWCMIIVICISPFLYFIPGSDKGSVENLYDDIVMLSNSTTLCIMCLGFIVSVWFYNNMVA